MKTFTGYDGNGYSVGDRVELHPGTDLWIRGARYGTVIGSSLTRNDRVHVRLDAFPERKFHGNEDTFRFIRESKIGCGCCTMGCVCHMHQDVPRGTPAKTCKQHA